MTGHEDVPEEWRHTPYTYQAIQDGECPTWWASHSCDLRAGHISPHVCMPDSETGDPQCETRTGAETDPREIVQHIDPADSCGDHMCNVCFENSSEPCDLSASGYRRCGRRKDIPEHDARLCRWCWRIGDNTPADEVFTKLPNGHTRWNIREATDGGR